MRIAEIMTPEVETIGPDALAEVAADRMEASRIHHLVVVEGSPRAPSIVGVLSSGDLAALRRAGAGKNLTVRQLMSPDPLCVAPGTLVRRAANLIRGRAVGSLPVIDGGRLVGIVTISDLLELLGRGVRRGPSGRVDHAPRRRASTVVRSRGPGRGV
jgi:CBS domain-containing protein